MNHKIPIEIRLLKYIIKDENPDNCWKWIGAKRKNGYGRINVEGSICYSHRVSYEIHKGLIPNGMYVCHTCDNQECCNPFHLWLGTSQENTVDMYEKGRSTSKKGDKNPKAKLSGNSVLDIRKKLSEGISTYAIAKEYQISQGGVWNIKSRRTWNHL